MNYKDKSKLAPLSALKYLFKDPITIRYPQEEKEGYPGGFKGVSPKYRGMHSNDLEKCIGCGSCSEICPTDAIRMVEAEDVEEKFGATKERPIIDYGRCCFCAFCVEVCTTGSLNMTRDYIHDYVSPIDKMGKDLSEAISEEYIRRPDYKHEDNLGWDTPDEYSWLELERVEMEELKPSERDHSFIEIVKGFSKEQATKEAQRCVSCGLCTEVCPAHMDIPEYIQSIFDADLEEGLRQLYKTNPLPEICGRICTHKCETACSIAHRGEALSIRWLKRYIADSVPLDSYKKYLGIDYIKQIDKKIAIVGAGPAGLSAAYYLSLLGYKTTIFEALPKPGGMMRYGIPEYRLPYDQIDKDINFIESLGVEIKCNTRVGKDITLDELHKTHDVVYIATGLHLGRSTRIPGSDHKDVYYSTDLLREVSLGNEIPVEKKIVIIGGGNVAMDITRTLARLQNIKYGKVDITTTSLESEDIMPADREEIVEAREEGATIDPGWGPKEIEIKNGKVVGLHVVKCLSVFDEDHRFSPKFDESQKKFFAADMVVQSIGQGMDLSYISEDIKSKLTFGPRGRIKVNENFQTDLDWLFVGGDIIQGPDAIHGIANGHTTAKAIDDMLNKNK